MKLNELTLDLEQLKIVMFYLDNEERGILLTALYEYAAEGKHPVFGDDSDLTSSSSVRLWMAFETLASYIDRRAACRAAYRNALNRVASTKWEREAQGKHE